MTENTWQVRKEVGSEFVDLITCVHKSFLFLISLVPQLLIKL